MCVHARVRLRACVRACVRAQGLDGRGSDVDLEDFLSLQSGNLLQGLAFAEFSKYVKL